MSGGDGWCGHRGRYQVTALLCGRRGHADRMMRCEECKGEYLASDLARWRQADNTQRGDRARAQYRAALDGLPMKGQESKREDGAMAAPSRTGNPRARQEAQRKDEQQVEQLGDGWIAGTLGADPELRYTPTGRAVCNLRVAYSPRIQDEQTGRWENGETTWYGVDVWGQQGENIAECLAKGDRVVLGGEFRRRTYTTRDGEERTVDEITARDIGPSLLFATASVKRTERRKRQ